MKPVKQSTMNSRLCRDCKKQWNLDKQREKKKKLAKEALAEKTVEAGKACRKATQKAPGCRRRKNFCRTSCPAKEKEKTSGISGKRRKADRFFC